MPNEVFLSFIHRRLGQRLPALDPPPAGPCTYAACVHRGCTADA